MVSWKCAVMRLHYIPTSPNGIKVRAALQHLSIPAELAAVDPLAGGLRSPDFLALNPYGRTPVLEDDGYVLWESNPRIVAWYESIGRLPGWRAALPAGL